MVTHEPDMAAFARTIVHFKDGLVERIDAKHHEGEKVSFDESLPGRGKSK
jgi:putative ABC transport system ATP-binding protein